MEENIIDKIELNGSEYDIRDSKALRSIQSITYSELVSLRDNSSLIPSQKYRIIDYVTTTTQTDTESANHPFDIIVEATSKNMLSELAQAVQREGDTYFEGSDLGAWQLWYDLNNSDHSDKVNGKGTIYRMIDNKGNDCPYDFKNIKFKKDASWIRNNKHLFKTIQDFPNEDSYFFTFSLKNSSGEIIDGSSKCSNNKLGKYCSGNIFFISNYEISSDNVLEDYCRDNIFENSTRNELGDSCKDNIFTHFSNYNKLNSNCGGNIFYLSLHNKLGHHCSRNIFKDYSNNNVLGYDLGSSAFDTIYSSNCNTNTFEKSELNTLEVGCCENIFKQSKCNNLRSDNSYNTFQGNFNIVNTSYRSINNNNISITLNEEYYDDGNNSLVPTKHPDISTQPSILPYKFMGNYVYEQLFDASNGNKIYI